jgi:predicted Zn-dependent protease with MMP-like domain
VTKAEIIDAAMKLYGMLPAQVSFALKDVRMEVVEGIDDEAIYECLAEEELELDEEIAADARGLYVGTIPEPSDDETDDAEPPKGLILLFASNITDADMVKLTLAHEIGHALGMSEDEVEGLNLF